MDASEIALALKTHLLVIGAAMVRTSVAVRVAPFTGPQFMSGFTRVAVALPIACLTLPVALPAAAIANPSGVALVFIALKEAIIGLVIGLAAGLFFWIAQAVGVVADSQRGGSGADNPEPVSGEPGTPLGNLLFQCFLMCFLAGGGLYGFFSMIIASYGLWPVFSAWPDFGGETAQLFLYGQLDIFMRWTVLLAGPVLLVGFMVDFGLGLISRFAPTLNVFFMAMPIKSAFSLLLMIILMPTIMQMLGTGFDARLAWLRRLREFLS